MLGEAHLDLPRMETHQIDRALGNNGPNGEGAELDDVCELLALLHEAAGQVLGGRHDEGTVQAAANRQLGRTVLRPGQIFLRVPQFLQDDRHLHLIDRLLLVVASL